MRPIRPVDLIFPEGKMLKDSGKCPTCGTPVTRDDLVDDLSKKEFDISGMCQKCQNLVFGKPKKRVVSKKSAVEGTE